MYFRVMIKETVKGTVSRESYCLLFVNELLLSIDISVFAVFLMVKKISEFFQEPLHHPRFYCFWSTFGPFGVLPVYLEYFRKRERRAFR
jgi:hypothetical protein